MSLTHRKLIRMLLRHPRTVKPPNNLAHIPFHILSPYTAKTTRFRVVFVISEHVFEFGAAFLGQQEGEDAPGAAAGFLCVGGCAEDLLGAAEHEEGEQGLFDGGQLWGLAEQPFGGEGFQCAMEQFGDMLCCEEHQIARLIGCFAGWRDLAAAREEGAEETVKAGDGRRGWEGAAALVAGAHDGFEQILFLREMVGQVADADTKRGGAY